VMVYTSRPDSAARSMREISFYRCLEKQYTQTWPRRRYTISKTCVKSTKNPERNNEAILRVFHVQNADWAARYLLRKFNIHNRDDLVGTDFGRYVKHRRPERRGGKPFMSGKTWKVQYDPWRGISKTSFSADYLKPYAVPDPMNRCDDDGFKMMELNRFDDQGGLNRDPLALSRVTPLASSLG
ncbi:hypothetical protein CISG_10386, partial [Coccidioides immitis RMSCC 3703]